jgi:hypothetical protein
MSVQDLDTKWHEDQSQLEQAPSGARIMGVRVGKDSMQYLISWVDTCKVPRWEEAFAFRGTSLEKIYKSEIARYV